MASNQATFEANIKWGYSNDDIDMSSLPKEFSAAKELWATKKEENLAKAAEMISPYVTCLFLGSYCDGDLSELFDSDMEELEATSVIVYGVDFTDSNLPKVKASAIFENVSTEGKLDEERLDAWQDENGYLDTCVSFEWRLDDVDEDLDLHSWNHSGLSLQLK